MDSITNTSTQFYQCKYDRVPLLTADNYLEWSTTLTNFLRANKIWKIVQGLETVLILPEPREPRPARGSRRMREPSSDSRADLDHDYEEKLDEFESKAARACSMIISFVSLSYQQFIFTLTNPNRMWNILKTQLDSTKANAGPFILRSQFYKERYTSSNTSPTSTYFAKLQQYQTRLSTTPCAILDNDLISHVLANGTLPSQFETTLEILCL